MCTSFQIRVLRFAPCFGVGRFRLPPVAVRRRDTGAVPDAGAFPPAPLPSILRDGPAACRDCDREKRNSPALVVRRMRARHPCGHDGAAAPRGSSTPCGRARAVRMGAGACGSPSRAQPKPRGDHDLPFKALCHLFTLFVPPGCAARKERDRHGRVNRSANFTPEPRFSCPYAANVPARPRCAGCTPALRHPGTS